MDAVYVLGYKRVVGRHHVSQRANHADEFNLRKLEHGQDGTVHGGCIFRAETRHLVRMKDTEGIVLVVPVVSQAAPIVQHRSVQQSLDLLPCLARSMNQAGPRRDYIDVWKGMGAQITLGADEVRYIQHPVGSALGGRCDHHISGAGPSGKLPRLIRPETERVSVGLHQVPVEFLTDNLTVYAS